MKLHAEFCFATLALGQAFVFHAQRLAQDVARFSPNTWLVILTDLPNAFQKFPHVVPVPHRQQGVFRCYHDKRFLVNEGLKLAKACIIIDANIRLLEPVAPRLSEPFGSGLSATRLYTIASKWESDQANAQYSDPRSIARQTRERRIVSHILDQLDLSPDDVFFPQEFLYAVKVVEGSEEAQKWLRGWNLLADYFDFHRLAWSEGFGIGIAAAATGFPLECVRVLPDFHFYKKRTFEFNLKSFRNPISPAQEACHAEQESFEAKLSPRYPKLNKFKTRLGQLTRYSRFRLKTWNDRNLIEQLRALSNFKPTATKQS